MDFCEESTLACFKNQESIFRLQNEIRDNVTEYNSWHVATFVE